FLNWYETNTLRPLPPAYVSTVDSGNLLACLLVLKNGLAEKREDVVPSPASIDGLLDAIHLAAEQLPKGAADAFRVHLQGSPVGPRTGEIAPTLLDWHDWLAKAEELAAGLPGGSENWSEAVLNQVRAMREEVKGVYPWVAVLPPGRVD